jgi:hypothetical protein
MIGFGTLVATALLSMVSATALAQQEPAAYAAANPDPDILNGGARNANAAMQPLATGSARYRGRRRSSQ